MTTAYHKSADTPVENIEYALKYKEERTNKCVEEFINDTNKEIKEIKGSTSLVFRDGPELREMFEMFETIEKDSFYMDGIEALQKSLTADKSKLDAFNDGYAAHCIHKNHLQEKSQITRHQNDIESSINSAIKFIEVLKTYGYFIFDTNEECNTYIKNLCKQHWREAFQTVFNESV